MDHSKTTLPLSLLAVLVLGAWLPGCPGPSCHSYLACDPVCGPGEFCNDSGECEAIRMCEPACETATEYCDPTTGECRAYPRSCTPDCATGQYCDDGTCRNSPVCDPACAADEYCE